MAERMGGDNLSLMAEINRHGAVVLGQPAAKGNNGAGPSRQGPLQHSHLKTTTSFVFLLSVNAQGWWHCLGISLATNFMYCCEYTSLSILACLEVSEENIQDALPYACH